MGFTIALRMTRVCLLTRRRLLVAPEPKPIPGLSMAADHGSALSGKQRRRYTAFAIPIPVVQSHWPSLEILLPKLEKFASELLQATFLLL